ncbi:MAG: flagellar FlbD family protein [Clostridia bacterium]|nr:flagellar FlbD family protein [Clostridia bacterium]
MIRLTRLNGTNFVLNCELIETVEATPDTVISTVHGKKLVVSEGVEEVVEKVIQYKSKILLSQNELANK